MGHRESLSPTDIGEQGLRRGRYRVLETWWTGTGFFGGLHDEADVGCLLIFLPQLNPEIT